VASTTFHIADMLLREIDRAARRMGLSRNRFVIKACEEALARQAGEWPEGFFNPLDDHEERKLLAEATRDLEREVLARRMNRGAVAQ
jgi:metal-responsive CopG/Arc/MetJ family transcriptional regulator